MRKIVYYVAVSLDGYICGPAGDISKFALEGEGVDRYLYDLNDFDTVIMGRNTYEFGYAFGLKPGQPAYPHMEHFIFSDTLKFEASHENVHVEKPRVERIKQLKQESGSPIYLCGGGQFAGWLLENDLIDELKLKLNPIILGDGVRLFGSADSSLKLKMKDSTSYSDGLQILTYSLT